MPRGPREADRKTRTYAQDLEDIAKNAKSIGTVYAQLEERARKLANVTEETRDRFQDQVDIGKKLIKIRKKNNSWESCREEGCKEKNNQEEFFNEQNREEEDREENKA